MADDADITAERDEREAPLRLSASRRFEGRPSNGECHWCHAPIRPMLRYCDVDVNGHVNNTRAGDWICDMLGPERLKGRPIRHLVINYSREITGGDPVDLSLTLRDDRFSMACRRDGDLLLCCGGELGL